MDTLSREAVEASTKAFQEELRKRLDVSIDTASKKVDEAALKLGEKQATEWGPGAMGEWYRIPIDIKSL